MPVDRLEAFEQWLLNAHPNPNRVGCPPKEILKDAAERKLAPLDPTNAHLQECSPCFAEFRELRDRRRLRERRQRLLWQALGAAAAILVVAATILFWRKSTNPDNREIAVHDHGPAPTIVGILDFRGLVSRRASAEDAPAETPRELTQATNQLQIVLPQGSDVGDYIIKISPDVPRLSNRYTTFEAKASIGADGVVRLQSKVDLSSLPKGSYVLGWQRIGSDLSGTGSFFIK